MSNIQWRVLIILLVAIGVEVLFNPATLQGFKGAATGKTFLGLDIHQPIAEQITGPTVRLFGYIVGILVLLLVANAAPQIATWFAVLILAYALLSHSRQIADLAKLGTGG